MNVTALLAHPDDELMCAGTLARLAQSHDVTLVTLFVDERRPEWEACARELGIKALTWFDMDEDEFVWNRYWVRRLEFLIPHADLWISHRADDANTSHGHIAKIVQTISRKNRSTVWECAQTLPGGIVTTAPNLYVNITEHRLKLLRAIRCYRSQIVRYPGLEEAIDARNAMQGWQIGVGCAEAFTVHKAVWL